MRNQIFSAAAAVCMVASTGCFSFEHKSNITGPVRDRNDRVRGRMDFRQHHPVAECLR